MSCPECAYITGHDEQCHTGTRFAVDHVEVRVAQAEDRIEDLEDKIRIQELQLIELRKSLALIVEKIGGTLR